MDNIVLVCVYRALMPWHCTRLFFFFLSVCSHVSFWILKPSAASNNITGNRPLKQVQNTTMDWFWQMLSAAVSERVASHGPAESAGRRHIVLSNTMAKGSDGWLVALKKKFKYLTHFSALFFVWQVRIQQGLGNTHVGCCFPWVYFSGLVQRIKKTSTVE